MKWFVVTNSATKTRAPSSWVPPKMGTARSMKQWNACHGVSETHEFCRSTTSDRVPHTRLPRQKERHRPTCGETWSTQSLGADVFTSVPCIDFLFRNITEKKCHQCSWKTLLICWNFNITTCCLSLFHQLSPSWPAQNEPQTGPRPRRSVSNK